MTIERVTLFIEEGIMPHTLRPSIVAASVALALLLGAASVASASSSSLGIRAGFSSNPDQLLIGAHFQPPAIAEHLYIVPSGEAGFGDHAFTLSFNGDLEYQFGPQGTVRPYVGGGLALYYVNVDNGGSDTNLGANVLGGLLFDRKSGHPFFLELKLPLSDQIPDLKIVGGIMFR